MPPVTVVGAGHNGLVCACELAARGIDVLVVEAAEAPGGGVTSAELTLPGFVHDRCAGFFPVSLASPAMRAQELERHGVEWVSPPSVMAHPFEDASAIELAIDLETTVTSIEASAPGAGRAWDELLRSVLPVREEIARTVFSRLPPPPGAVARLALALRRQGIELGRRALGSIEAFGLDLFGAPRPAAWL